MTTKNYYQTLLAFITRLIGNILCFYLSRSHLSSPDGSCNCWLLPVLFIIAYLFAMVIDMCNKHYTGFFSTLVSIGLGVTLGFYFISLSHSISGVIIIIFGLALPIINYLDDKDKMKDEVKC